MKLQILTFPDERLKQVSKPVERFDPELHALLDSMAETMYAAKGVGLAAPQVGIFIRAFLIDVSESEEKQPRLLEFINPTFSEGSGKATYQEGCLSVPGVTEEVNRRESITVSYQDRFGKSHTLRSEGILAIALQHENDHLDGILFVDRVSPFKRRFLKRRLEKALSL